MIGTSYYEVSWPGDHCTNEIAAIGVQMQLLVWTGTPAAAVVVVAGATKKNCQKNLRL